MPLLRGVWSSQEETGGNRRNREKGERKRNVGATCWGWSRGTFGSHVMASRRKGKKREEGVRVDAFLCPRRALTITHFSWKEATERRWDKGVVVVVIFSFFSASACYWYIYYTVHFYYNTRITSNGVKAPDLSIYDIQGMISSVGNSLLLKITEVCGDCAGIWVAKGVGKRREGRRGLIRGDISISTASSERRRVAG